MKGLPAKFGRQQARQQTFSRTLIGKQLCNRSVLIENEIAMSAFILFDTLPVRFLSFVGVARLRNLGGYPYFFLF